MPNYPNFGVERKAHGTQHLGQIGWGMDKPDLAVSSNQNSIERLHVKYWDRDHPSKRFLDLSGKFTTHQDKQLEV